MIDWVIDLVDWYIECLTDILIVLLFLSQVAAAAVVAGIRLVFVSNQSLSLPPAATAPSLIMWGTIAANNIYRVFLKMGSKYLEKWTRGMRNLTCS